MFRVTIAFLIIFVSNLNGQEDFKKITETAIKAKSGDKQSITDLYKASLDKNNKELHTYLVKAVSLMMLKSSSKATGKYLQNVKALNLDPNVLLFLETPPVLQDCAKCKGFGLVLSDCRRCKEGACRNCKGSGVISYGSGKSKKENPCVSCKKTGHCHFCKGSNKIPVKCSTCRAKGAVFNRAAFAEKSNKALDVLINKALELDGDSATAFDVEVLDADEKEKKAAQVWLSARKTRAAEWKELERKRLAAVKKRNSGKKNSNFITMEETEVVETYEEGGSTSTLDQICLEISEYLQGQERKSKQSILTKVYGQFLSDVPTIHVVVSDEFLKGSYDYKQRAADGFFRFSLLRAQRNGYEEIAFKLLDNAGNQIGGTTEKGFVLKK